MNPTTTIMIAALALALAAEASAQSRTYYDKGGNVTGKSDRQPRHHDVLRLPRKVTDRTSNGSGDTITIYDASGRAVGRATKDR